MDEKLDFFYIEPEIQTIYQYRRPDYSAEAMRDAAQKILDAADNLTLPEALARLARPADAEPMVRLEDINRIAYSELAGWVLLPACQQAVNQFSEQLRALAIPQKEAKP